MASFKKDDSIIDGDIGALGGVGMSE